MQKFILFMVLVLGLAATVVFYQKYQKEQRQKAEIARQQELVRQQQAKAEAEKLEREYKEAEEKRRAEAKAAREEALRKRAEEKARREQEKKAAVEKAQDARRDVCRTILTALEGAELRPWKTAPDADRPERVKTAQTFHCLLPDGEGSRMLLEQKVDFGRTVKATRIDSLKENEAFEPESFDRTVAIFPNLLICGTHVYFRPAHAELDASPVPSPGQAFDPAENDFGLAYDIVKQTGLKTSAFVYDVSFQPFDDTATSILVATVPFGQTVPFETFRDKVSAWAKRNQAALAKAKKKAPPKKVWKPLYVFTDKTVVKKRLDGVTEVPRTFVARTNKHRYDPLSREYENEAKKEEFARQKWQALYDKAKADEEKAQALKGGSADAKKTGSTGNALLDAGSVIYKLHE